MIDKQSLYHLVRVNDFEQEVSSIDFMSIVNEFQDVFLENLPGVPSEREIDFCVDLDLNRKKISIPPCRLAPAELKEMNFLLKDLLDRGFIHSSISP